MEDEATEAAGGARSAWWTHADSCRGSRRHGRGIRGIWRAASRRSLPLVWTASWSCCRGAPRWRRGCTPGAVGRHAAITRTM